MAKFPVSDFTLEAAKETTSNSKAVEGITVPTVRGGSNQSEIGPHCYCCRYVLL
jgi:hypothetical protein